MPSRTYIQMILELYENGKIFLAKASVKELKKYNAVLEKHPEDIEEIVRRRVNMIKFAKVINPQIKILYWHYALFERCILDYMFMAELIEVPMFDDFDITPSLTPNLNRISIGFEPVIPNAIVVLDEGIGRNFDTPIEIAKEIRKNLGG